MRLRKTLAVLLASLLLTAAAAPTLSALEPHGTGLPMRDWLTNDPNYTFSEAYKTSVWYQNFSSLELTENDRNNVLRIAVSQLGYHEGDSAADFNGMNFNGSSNYIEYARLLVPHYNDNHYEWCACFVNWCLNQARYDKASSEIGCWRWVQELKSMKLWQDSAAYKGTYTPKPADFIFFNWNNVNTGSGHIGYVLYTTDTHVFTIEGNADNNVTVRSYALDNPCVIGYGTPAYDEGDEPTMDYSYADGMPRGTYVVNSMQAFLRKAPDSGRICKVPVGSTVVLYEVEGDYAKVRYGDSIGYLPTNILWLMTKAVGEDTVTYDANGGTDAPESDTFIVGEPATITEAVPTLEGDTFLGWSLTPYNAKPDYKSGDAISLAGDTILYAVWEKHSVELADEAFSQGKAPEYERPTSITNSSALLMGSLTDPSLLNPNGDTKVELVEVPEAGKVLSFTSTAQSSDPYVTLPYGDWMRSLRLAPVTGENAAYAVLRVKNLTMNNTAVELFFNGSDKKVTALLTEGNEWQYVVFDLASVDWDGALQTLRIDWERAADEAGNTMYLAEIYFAPNREVMQALTDGKYVYPTQELLEPETDPPTEEPTEPATEPASGEDTADATTTADETQPSEGCGSVLGMAALVSLTAATVGAVTLRKKED